MASLRDVRPVLKSYGKWAFIKRIFQQCNEDNIFVWASALAYSWLFSLFPFLILLLSLVPYLPAHARASAGNAVANFMANLLGPKEGEVITKNIQPLINEPRTTLLVIGLCVSLWAASSGMQMTMSALDQCYDIKNGRPYYKQRLTAILITIAVTVFVLLLFLLLPIGALVQRWALSTGVISRELSWAFSAARYVLAALMSLVVVTIIYQFGPSIRQKFQFLSPGAVFCILVWLVLDESFRIYVDRFAHYNKWYGTVGGVAILLLFFYIDALVLLIGAEINSEIDFERLGVPSGSRDFTGPPAQNPSASSAQPDHLLREL